MKVHSEVRDARLRGGLSAAALGTMAGVTRQTIHAIEAGTYVPNTAVALGLARALNVTVEDLFQLDGTPADPAPTRVRRLPGDAAVAPGQPAQLCRVGNRLFATTPSSERWYLPESDAVVRSRNQVSLLQPDSKSSRVLIAGCDPGLSVLARHMQRGSTPPVMVHRNSTQALKLLEQRCIHVAGTHIENTRWGRGVAVFSFAEWEEGLVVARGNPRGIGGIADIARRGVAFVNREKGSGSRRLLDAELKRAGLLPSKVSGYDTCAHGHLDAAARVRDGQADCCIATRSAARLCGLGFVTIVAERFNLAVRRSDLNSSGVQVLLNTLNSAGFRRDLAAVAGYDTGCTGRQVV